jgi:glycosyltransferase involved in cell wall biosynthesis
VDGESRKIVEESGGGVFIAPESAEQLAQAVLRMSRDMAWAEWLGRAGGEFVRRYYSRDALAEDYLDVLRRVKHGSAAPCSYGTRSAKK